MNALEQANLYFDAWNRHRPRDVLATFAPGGIYEDPATGGPVSGEGIVQQVDGLIHLFPDVSFEVLNAAATSERTVAAEWMMTATHSQPIFGLPPTGARVELHGADFIVVSDEGIVSVRGYFNEGEYLRQLGLEIHTLPAGAIGPVAFGTGTYVQSGKVVKPGAVSITVLSVRDEEEASRINQTAWASSTRCSAWRGSWRSPQSPSATA